MLRRKAFQMSACDLKAHTSTVIRHRFQNYIISFTVMLLWEYSLKLPSFFQCSYLTFKLPYLLKHLEFDLYYETFLYPKATGLCIHKVTCIHMCVCMCVCVCVCVFPYINFPLYLQFSVQYTFNKIWVLHRRFHQHSLKSLHPIYIRILYFKITIKDKTL
jgi:hypothetical protein